MTIAEIHRTRETLRAHLTPHVRASDLARTAGVSPQYISDVLHGHRPPSAKLLAAAAKLGIPVEVPKKSANPAFGRGSKGSRVDNDGEKLSAHN
jgi:transcriptional regulator with XRE-family HTH domain